MVGNTKMRALLWEEARVAGSIAAAMLAVGVVALVPLRLSYIGQHNLWHHVGDHVRAVVILVPALTALLLVLGMGNSGQMRGGGFPRRLLRLPVRTRTLVTLALVSRTALLLLVSALLVLCANLLFGQRLDYSPVLLIAAGYLVIQLADWVRPVAPMLAVAAVAALAALLPQADALSLGVAGNALPWTALAAGGAVLAGAVWGLGLWVVDLHRHGETVRWLALPRWREPWEGHWTPKATPFKSPFAALFWFEMRRTSLFLPLATALFWVLGAALIAGLQWPKGDENSFVMPPDVFVFQILPFAALILAAFVWHGFAFLPSISASGKRGFAGPSPVLPAPPGALGSARLAGAALNLSLALGMAWTTQVVHFLVMDGGRYGQMLARGLAEDTVSVREAVISLLGPGLVVAGACWVLMTSFYGIVFLFLARHVLFISPDLYDYYSLGLFLFLIIVLPFPALFLAEAWAGRHARRTVAGVMLFWALLAMALFPFSNAAPQRQILDVLFCLGLSGALVSCWPFSLINRWGCTGHRVPAFHRCNHPAVGGRKATPRVPRALAVAAVALLCLTAWLRWPFEPAWQKEFRDQGLPVTLEELEAAHPPVPKSENLAELLLAAAEAAWRMEEEWVRTQPEYGTLKWTFRDRQPLRGEVSVERRSKVPADALEITAAYRENVGRHVSAMVHEAVTSGLTRSRYPMNIRKLLEDDRNHLSFLFELSRNQLVEAFLAVMEGRNQDAVTALADTLGMADSLREDPFLISQLGRGRLLQQTTSDLELVLNRTILSEEHLARLQTALFHALPPRSEPPFMEPSFHFETVIAMHQLEKMLDGLFGVSDKLVIVDDYRERRDWARAILRTRAFPDRSKGHGSRDLVPRTIPLMMYGMLRGAFTRAQEAEFRFRTHVNLARTALAVERFRGATGRLPERLEELVPEWLDEVPADYWNEGKPLSYRVRQDGEYVVYSFSQDREDDGGDEVKKWWRDGDMTFTVAPPEARAELRVPAVEGAES